MAMAWVLAAMSCADAGAAVSVIISNPILFMVGIIVARKILFHSSVSGSRRWIFQT